MSNYTKSTNFATKDNLTPGDPLKIVRGTEIDTEFNNIATAIATKTDNASAAITGGSITGITDLAIADGGTGASTANAALNNLLPSQASASGKYLKSNGTDSSWDALDISTADITGTLPVANGGTGVTSSTGTGSVVLSNSPTLVTPALGTPASGVATNLTGLPLTTGVTGTLPIANGGTGQTTANAAFNALAPSQATASGKYLKSDGTNTSWDALDISTADITGTLPVANGGTGVTTSTGTGSVVLSNSPTLVTPALGTPSSATLTNATGLPISTGVSGLGTGVATALAVNVGSAGAPVVNGGALGTPSSGTVTNLTGTASININGTVGATTPTTGAFTTTTVSTSETLSYGTANGVTYLNGSKVLTSGSALTFDGTVLNVGSATFPSGRIRLKQADDTTKQKGLLIEASGDDSILAIGYDGSAFTFNPTYNTTGAYKPMAWWVSGSEQMRLTSTQLLVGGSSTDLSSVKSSIIGSGGFAVQYAGSSGTYLQVTPSAANGNVDIKADARTGNYPAITFTTSATTRATLDSAGNLGLGVTPSAWRTTYKALQTNGGSFYGFTSNDRVGVSQNAYVDATSFQWTYTTTAAATNYLQISGEHQWYRAASGTAGTSISFTQAMTLDASGNLGVGTTSPSARVHVSGTTDATQRIIVNGSGNVSSYKLNYNGSEVAFIQNYQNSEFAIGTAVSAWMGFNTNNTERMRIDASGNLLVGTTSQAGAGKATIYFDSASNNGLGIKAATVSGSTNIFVVFKNSADGTAGLIQQNGLTTVAYTTSSDYRLKENVQPMTGALSVVAALKPVTYTWKADGSAGQGFIAHELQAVVPDAVVGEKDAVDEEGNPVYQGVDTSFLVATLTAALQEAVAKITALEARLDAANL